MKAREKAKQSKTFHGAGMVVPFNKETDVGYREIPETTASLKKILKNVSCLTYSCVNNFFQQLNSTFFR